LTPWLPVGFMRCLSLNARSLQAPRFTVSGRIFPGKGSLMSCQVLHGGSPLFRQRPISAAIHQFLGSGYPDIAALLHGGTPSCRRQATSSGIHNLLGAALLALRRYT
jgi:hypothetical protein